MKRIALSVVACLAFAVGSIAQTTFNYTGAVQTYTVPAGVTSIQVECWGAQGADHGSSSGGLGGYVSGEMTVTPGQVLEIYVGGIDGYNGGGAAGTGGSADLNGVVGGGASDVRISPYALADRVIVAGGGGGAGRGTCSNQDGGDGGWPGGTGGTGSGIFTSNDGTLSEGGSTVDGACSGDCSCSPSGGGGGGGDGGGGGGSYGTVFGGVVSNGGTGGACGDDGDDTGGGTGSAGGGGCFGVGGAGGSYSNGGGGGGGGGWYGGGAGGGNWAAGGGGGSSHFDAAITSTSFTNGTNSGDGQVVITELCTGLTYTVSDDTVCVGDEVTLDATSTLGGTVTWDGGVTNGTPFTPPAGSTTYNATSSDAGDCGLSITIFVGDYPTVDGGADQDVCDGDSTMVTASGTATDYSWDGGVTDGVYFTPTGTTTLTVTGTIDSTGCETTDMVEITVVVPDVSITATGSTLMSNQAGADSYQWIDCHDMSPIAGETSQSYTPSADGDYAVIVTVSGCTDTSACQASYAGVEDLQNGNKPHVYPNPTDGKVTIYAKGTFSYQLMSLKGDVILQGEGKDSEELDLEDFPAGAYMINVITEFGIQPVKVMKR